MKYFSTRMSKLASIIICIQIFGKYRISHGLRLDKNQMQPQNMGDSFYHMLQHHF